MEPQEIDFTSYKKRSNKGVGWHEDGSSIFGTIVIILQGTAVGRLHIEGVYLPESFYAGDIVVLDPTCFHKVQAAFREKDRVTATVVL